MTKLKTMRTEIKVFKPNSREIDVHIKALKPTPAANKLAEVLNTAASNRAKRTIAAMRKGKLDTAQFVYADRRIRITTPII